jgi:hypothetical protein
MITRYSDIKTSQTFAYYTYVAEETPAVYFKGTPREICSGWAFLCVLVLLSNWTGRWTPMYLNLNEKLTHFALKTEKLRDYCCYEI